MMENETSNLLQDGAARLGILLTEDQMMAFDLYLKELNSWKKHINLVRRENNRDIILKDFIDSMTILKHLPPGASLADLGSGAGFPGIPVKDRPCGYKGFPFRVNTKEGLFFEKHDTGVRVNGN